MKALFEQVEIGLSQSFKVKRYYVSNLDVPYHFHPEIEIVLVLKSTGRVFVRNSFVSFASGDLFIFGTNVPHMFINDPEYYNEELPVELIVVQLHQDLERLMLQLPELSAIKNLLKLSNAGLKYTKVVSTSVGKRLTALSDQFGLEKLVSLFTLLSDVQKTFSYECVDRVLADEIQPIIPERLQVVKRFLLDNYNRNLALDEVADIASMSKASFCRYFKQHTRKTFSQYLNELRVDYASKLLVDGFFPISRICYEVGYNHLPYFIKQFKKIHGITPKQYRHKHSSTFQSGLK